MKGENEIDIRLAAFCTKLGDMWSKDDVIDVDETITMEKIK